MMYTSFKKFTIKKKQKGFIMFIELCNVKKEISYVCKIHSQHVYHVSLSIREKKEKSLSLPFTFMRKKHLLNRKQRLFYYTTKNKSSYIFNLYFFESNFN